MRLIAPLLTALLLAGPATAGSLPFDPVSDVELPALIVTPYNATLTAQAIPLTSSPEPADDVTVGIVGAQIIAILLIVLFVLRPLPSAQETFPSLRHALAALARSRTRSIMARRPLDL